MIRKILYLSFLVVVIQISVNAESIGDRISTHHKNHPDTSQLVDALNDRLSLLAVESFPAIVNISTTQEATLPNQDPFWFFYNDPFFNPGRGSSDPRQRRQIERGGSGFVISEDGYVLTNFHVIKGADNIVITRSDSQSYTAKVIGSDEKTDVALLKIEEEGLPYLAFADSDQARIGETVVAIGNPFNVGATMTSGIISAKGRNNVGITAIEDFIQTDAAVNPGNSGGPLLNINGDVVGMNTAILSRSGGYQGISFAIPANVLKTIIESLKATGRFDRAFLGVVIQDMTPKISRAFNLELNQRGALISNVYEQSPAERAGLESGDIIINVDGKTIENAADLRNAISLQSVDEAVTITILRKNQRIQIPVDLERRKDTDISTAYNQRQSGQTLLSSMTLQELRPELRQRFNISVRINGVLITDILENTPAYQAGLRAGDVMLSINNRQIRNVSDVVNELDSKKDVYAILLHRNGVSQYLIIEGNK